MVTKEEKQTVLYYLSCLIRSPLSHSDKDSLLDWADNYGQDLFGFDLPSYWEPKKKNARNSSKKKERNVRELALLTLKNAPKTISKNGVLSKKRECILNGFNLQGNERAITGLLLDSKLFYLLSNLFETLDIDRNIVFSQYKTLAAFLSLPSFAIENAFCPDSSLVRKGLFEMRDDGGIRISDKLSLFASLPYKEGDDIKRFIVEEKAVASLKKRDFIHIKNEFDHLTSLLKGALKNKAAGVNILIYGVPGTGKTELAKTIADETKSSLYLLSENMKTFRKEDRIDELKMASSVIEEEENALLFVDEAEDFFTGSPLKDGPSKIFFNRMLEKNKTPIIWATNDISGMDLAYVRRFSYLLEMKTPPVSAREKIIKNQLLKNDLKLSDKAIKSLALKYDLPPSFSESAIRVAKIAGNSESIEHTLLSVEKAVKGKSHIVKTDDYRAFNPSLLSTDIDLKDLCKSLKKTRQMNFSLCLFGASGTGKSAYARYLAQEMGLEVIQKRASDLQSMYVGQTEKNISEAFAKAREDGCMLIFDEADSFLQDRRAAQRSWEISAVNEMLTWMESHPFPFVCTTNLMESLDPASLRRFTFKVKYEYLTKEQVIFAFEYFFKKRPATDISTLNALTPGDFAVVAKKREFLGDTSTQALIEMLSAEQEAKGIRTMKIGF